MKKTKANYYLFLRNYYEGSRQERLGQAFCNNFDITDSDLFYSENMAAYVVPTIFEMIESWPDE